MIYLSAQPDDFYFTWQLEIQLHNFRQLGICADQIHILISYDAKRGLQEHFGNLIDRYRQNALFFTYPDLRNTPKYTSSIRPHIIHQHFLAYPWLEEEAVFYLDSDVIFRAVPDFLPMLENDTWYVSDTRSYLDSKYIRDSGGDNLFYAMCSVVGVDSAVVIENDVNAGGAQYLLKKVKSSFWEKVEADSEALYSMMQNDNNQQANKKLNNGIKLSSYHGIQSWCADMWSMFWNAIYYDREVKISSELAFCWADGMIEDWYDCKILHYTGGIKKDDKRFFRKINYTFYTPYYDRSLDLIENGSCSYPLLQNIKGVIDSQNSCRLDLSDVSFLIPIRIDSESRLENLYAVTAFIDKYFKTSILVAEWDTYQKVDTSNLPNCSSYFFEMEADEFLHHTRMNNFLALKATTPIIAIYDADVVFPIDQILDAVRLIRNGDADMVAPYSGDFISVDRLFKAMFMKLLDPELLRLNQKKFITTGQRSWGGSAFLKRQSFLQAGMDNENFTAWGPEDIERPKRLKRLGYRVRRIPGPLFHLPHSRGHNSGYTKTILYLQFMDEYFRICSMPREELERYVEGWPWSLKQPILNQHG